MTAVEQQPKIELSAQDWVMVREILARVVPGLEVWAFGSRARFTAKPYSDLDLAVISPHPLPMVTMALLRESFDESDLPIKVDIADWATTKEPFRKIILENKVVVQHARAAGEGEQ